MSFRVIVTVGPSLLSNFETLQSIDAFGQCIYRINGAHVGPATFEEHVGYLRAALGKCSIMIDLPCNKVRTANLSMPINLEKGGRFQLYANQVNYPAFFKHLQPGDMITAMESVLSLEVVDVDDSRVTLDAHADGILWNNKGLHCKSAQQGLPLLFDKDLELIKKALQLGVDFVSLSFVRTADDVREVKKLLPTGVQLVAKIETASAVENVTEILDESDMVNIDRGDLSSEIGLLELGTTQDYVIQRALARKKQIFLATQFLKSMEEKPVPLIAEILDLERSIRSGISGIQLSEETAIGRYPTKCVKLIMDVQRRVSGGNARRESTRAA